MYYTLQGFPLLAIALVGIQARPLPNLQPRRFAQQNPQPVSNEVAQFPNGRNLKINAGQFGTLSGSIPGTLLGGSGACDEIKLADQMVDLAKSSMTGKDQTDFINIARDFAHSEKNFNNFAAKFGVVCDDATLPKNDELRGVLPLQDPGVTGAAAINTKTTQQLADIKSGKITGPKGQSIAQQFTALGFTSFTASNAAGAASDSSSSGGGGGSGAGAGGGSAGGSNSGGSSGNQNSSAQNKAAAAGDQGSGGNGGGASQQNDPCNDNGGNGNDNNTGSDQNKASDDNKGSGGGQGGSDGGQDSGNQSNAAVSDGQGAGGSDDSKQKDPCDDKGGNGNDKSTGGQGGNNGQGDAGQGSGENNAANPCP